MMNRHTPVVIAQETEENLEIVSPETTDSISQLFTSDTAAFENLAQKYINRIRIFKDEHGIRTYKEPKTPRETGPKKFGQATQMRNSALQQLCKYLDITEQVFLNDYLSSRNNWGVMCKRQGQSELALEYRKKSFKNAPFIVIGYDSGGNVRSYLTAGYKKYNVGRIEDTLYVDVVCGCSKSNCPLKSEEVHGPGGSNLLAFLLEEMMVKKQVQSL